MLGAGSTLGQRNSPNVTKILTQDRCPQDQSDHGPIVVSPTDRSARSVRMTIGAYACPSPSVPGSAGGRKCPAGVPDR